MSSSRSDNNITPRRRHARQMSQDDAVSDSTSEDRYPSSRTEIPDNVLRLPGVDSPPLDPDESTAVASDSDEEMRMLRGTTARSETLSLHSTDYPSETQSLESTYHQQPPTGYLGRPLDPSEMVRLHIPNALIESEWRERISREQEARQALREHHRDNVRYLQGDYHAPQPFSYQPDPGYVAFNYADAYGGASHNYDSRFEFTVIDVTLAVEHLFELALIQARRNRSGRSEPSDREHQLTMSAPFLLTYAARRELQGGNTRRSAAVDAFNRYVSEMAHQGIINARLSIS